MIQQELQELKKKIQDDIEWAEETLNEFHYNGCACTKNGALYTKLENKLQQYKLIQECIEAYEQLQEYKKLEAEGRLNIFPCALDTPVYGINSYHTCTSDDENKCPVVECTICPAYKREFYVTHASFQHWMSDLLGKEYFLTLDEAKERITKLEVNDAIQGGN